MLQLHERLGDFEIIRLLGKGGMGEVYEARQAHPDRLVAVKVLIPWLAKDDEALQRFWREAAVPANLDHPGIVRIISTGKTDDGVAYYAMHLVRGISLSEMIRRGGAALHSDVLTKSLDVNTPSMVVQPSDQAAPVSPAPIAESSPHMLADYRTDRFTTLARIGAQAARALAYAHQQGHIHRDIKPSNLMVDHHDHVYLVDFGLTRGLEPTASGTQAGIIVGTPWYMSPEQAEGKKLDARSDIYSLGVTLYELATRGVGPFTANREDKEGVLTQVRAGQVLPLRITAPDLPPVLEAIIQRAMERKPRKRYATAAELAADLEKFLEVSSKHSPHVPKFRLSGERKRWPVALGAAVVVLGMAIGITAVAVRMGAGSEKKDPPPSLERGNQDGKLAQPTALRTHPLGFRFGLIHENSVEPLWKEKLFGDGSYFPNAPDLNLTTRGTAPYVLAIAEPDRNCFDFSVEVGKIHSNNPDTTNQLGIVFGWKRRSNDTDVHSRFFVVELDETRVKGNDSGHLKVGAGWMVPPNKDRGTGGQWFTPLKEGKDRVLLRKSAPAYHTIQLKVRRESVRISADNGPEVEFSMAWMREKDARSAENLDPRGMIGLWVLSGRGCFRNPSITPIAD